jgi:hypothetical protein
MNRPNTQSRFASEAGIAIGPILFVVAILAILATAIAAGSSTFATNASQETNRTNSGSMIQLGQSLKMGFDRMAGLGIPPANVVINEANTTNAVDLFAPTGGGLVPPSRALAAAPASATAIDQWIYTWGAVNQLGTTAADKLALLRVTPGVCEQINLQAGVTYTLAAVDYGAFANATNLTTTSWPTELNGKMVGCIQGSHASATGYFFYQVLAVQ